jgi:hypothetical protein
MSRNNVNVRVPVPRRLLPVLRQAARRRELTVAELALELLWTEAASDRALELPLRRERRSTSSTIKFADDRRYGVNL